MKQNTLGDFHYGRFFNSHLVRFFFETILVNFLNSTEIYEKPYAHVRPDFISSVVRRFFYLVSLLANSSNSLDVIDLPTTSRILLIPYMTKSIEEIVINI